MTRRSLDIDGNQLTWHTIRGTLEFDGRPCAAFGLQSSLVAMLAPLRQELSTKLFRMLISHGSVTGTQHGFPEAARRNATSFEQAFSAWSEVCAASGWGRLELVRFEPEVGFAKVRVRNPWELVMQDQQPADQRWGCPALMGMIVGMLRHGFGQICRAEERCYRDGEEHVVEFDVAASPRSLETELEDLRAERDKLRRETMQAEVDRQASHLRASDETQRALLASLSDLVFSVGAGGILLDACVPEHPAAGRFPIGIRAGATLDEVFPRDVADRLYRHLEQVLVDGSVHELGYVMPIDGEARSYSARVSPLRNAGHYLVGATVVVRDVTEHKKLEEDLTQARKMESMGLLAGGVAHDFNNLLTAILGHIELLRGTLSTEKLDDPGMLSDLDEIQRSGQRAITLTRQLLAFSRHESVAAQDLDLDAILGDLEQILRRLLRDDIDLELVRIWGLPCIHADEGQIEQLILNLVINANDAMADGGTLTVETGCLELAGDDAARRELPPGRYVSLTVSDTGTGMEPELVKKIFEPFFTTKPVGRGTGLGLATVSAVVRGSGGHIDVISRPDEGTTFRILLPAVEAATLIPSPPRSPGRAPGGSETVLVCEDEPGVRSFVCRILTEHGYCVLEASNGTAALALANAAISPIDAVVTDVVMPGMNGPELADALRADRPTLRVLHMSGYAAEVLGHHGLREQDVELLRKPFDSATLLRRLRTLLDAPATAVQAP